MLGGQVVVLTRVGHLIDIDLAGGGDGYERAGVIGAYAERLARAGIAAVLGGTRGHASRAIAAVLGGARGRASRAVAAVLGGTLGHASHAGAEICGFAFVPIPCVNNYGE